MIRFSKIACFLVLVFSIITCSKDDSIQLNNDDYLIFGHFYGMCFGEECIEYFKLTRSKLYEDSNDNYGGEPFNFTELSTEKFEMTKTLFSSIPIELLDEKEIRIGCPDCADQGGIFIQYKNGNSIQQWRIDQSKNEIPKYLHPFLDKVNKAISNINS